MREKNCRIYKISFQANDTSIIIIKEFLEQSVITLPVTQNAILHQFLLKPKKIIFMQNKTMNCKILAYQNSPIFIISNFRI